MHKVLLIIIILYKLSRTFVQVMFVGAIDTSTTTLEWAMSELLTYPRARKKVQDQIDSIIKQDEKITYSHIFRMEYLHSIVKETLRLYPLIPLLVPHESTEACIVKEHDHDYFIPEKIRLMVNAWGIGRDPQVWKDLLEFRPERFMGKNLDIIKDLELNMISFGVGRRCCPGSSMGIAIVEVALGHLFHYFNWRSYGAIYMNESFGMTIPRKEHLLGIPTCSLSLNTLSYLKI